jgi:hypothetical protein
MENLKKSYASIFEELCFQVEDLQERTMLILTLNKDIAEETNTAIVDYLNKKLGASLNSIFVIKTDCIQVLIPKEEKLLLEDLEKLQTLI